MVDFGIKLAKLRENKRLSQSQLAARLGITKSMVSAYENSARMPSYAVLLRIAGMFNVSLDYLLGTENQIIFRTDGLSESQIAIIMDIIEEFKKWMDTSGLNARQKQLVAELVNELRRTK